MALNLLISIEDSLGSALGDGPIDSARRWQSTLRMDRAGSFSFEMPASDAKAALVQRKRIVRAMALVGGSWQEVGAGVIDRIERRPEPNGDVALVVSGDDLVRELSYRSVLGLRLYSGGLPITHAQALAALAGYAPSGWTFTPDPEPGSTVYGYFNGETVLAGAIKVAEKSKTHFCRGAGRSLVFGSSFTPSGLRAVQARGDLVPETCAIVALTEEIDVYDLLTRIYPRGSGNADVQLTLRAATRTAPAGYTLNKAENWIQHNAAAAQYGRIERQLDYREIGPVANTATDIQSAANALFDAAIEELRRAVALEQATYTLSLAGCAAVLRPMQTIRVVYRNTPGGLSVDADLNILEATLTVDANGVQTTGLVVSTSDKWALNEAGAIIGSITSGRIYQALPQLNANSYVTAYTKNVDADHLAGFRFRFGREVTQLQEVRFDFQLLAFESTVTGIGLSSTTGGSGQLETDGPSTNASGTPSNDTSGAASGNTGAASGNTGAATGNTGAASGNTGAATGNTGAASGNTGAPSTNTSGGPSTNTSGGSGTLTTGSPSGGDTVSSGRHTHRVDVSPTGTTAYPVYFYQNGENSEFRTSGGTGGVPVTVSGDHTHGLDTHTHNLASHTHDLGSHTHTLGSHTHDLGSHTHTLGSHSHDLGSHTHSLGSHTHDLGSHTHSLNAHTHSLSNHKHAFTPVIDMQYGIFRDDAENLAPLSALRYRVNGGAWAPLSDATAGAGGWYLLDLTAQVQDAVTLRPQQDNNMLEIGVIASDSAISSWTLAGGFLVVNTSAAHGLTAGDRIAITGAAAGSSGGNINAIYTVESIVDADSIRITAGVGTEIGGAGGTIKPASKATIDAQLAVRSIVQAIAYN